MSSDTTTRPRPRPRPSPVAPEPEPTRRDHRPWLVVAALLVAVVAAAAWLVVLADRDAAPTVRPSVDNAGKYTPGTIADPDGAAAVRATVAALPDVLGYDYRSLSAGLKRAKAHLTPEFRIRFADTFTDSVSPVAAKNKAVVKTLVRAVALSSRSGDTATVLAFVDQALVQSGGGTSPKISQDRVHVELVRAKGRWLVSAITPF